MALRDQNVGAIHLDAVGGVAGDMFAAAILDARPDLWPACEAALAALDLPSGAHARHASAKHKGFQGTRFHVQLPENGADGTHAHTPWAEIRDLLSTAMLPASVRGIAIDIFTILAEAEGAVHGIAANEVAFHEVGAIDSIIDIVVAATLIDALGPCTWSIGPLPQGRGQVKSQHGFLPVPAPATAMILTGFPFVDDGESGERVTPTGAAIIKHLKPATSPGMAPRALLTTGMGFGQKEFASRANVLRAVFYGAAEHGTEADTVEVLRCEIDDQTGEDLAVAIEHLRTVDGVLDVCQWPVFAKKGRIATALQILAQPSQADHIISVMLAETTTLGVRRSAQTREILVRQETTADGIRIKIADRPGGVTAKAEIGDVDQQRTAKSRNQRRHAAETAALDGLDHAK